MRDEFSVFWAMRDIDGFVRVSLVIVKFLVSVPVVAPFGVSLPFGAHGVSVYRSPLQLAKNGGFPEACRFFKQRHQTVSL